MFYQFEIAIEACLDKKILKNILSPRSTFFELWETSLKYLTHSHLSMPVEAPSVFQTVAA